MSVNLILSITSVGPKLGNVVLNGVAQVQNTEADTVTVMGIQITEASSFGAVISGPYFLTPNVAPGEGEPDISTSTSAYYPFQVVCAVPNTPGASPNAPGGLVGNTFPPSNGWLRLVGRVDADDSAGDPHVGTATLNIPLASAVAPFPVPMGGALQFNKTGANGIHWFF